MSQNNSSEFQPLNSARSVDAILQRVKIESDDRAIPNVEQGFHTQPMHVPYMAGCGSGYYPYASPITTSDDVVVVEELGDNYSCHVYATSRTAKINMPHEEISFVNYNTFSTSSGDGFSGHGLHNDIGSYTTGQFHNTFDQNVNHAWFATTPESNMFQQDQSYCSFRHNAPYVNDLSQGYHSQCTNPLPGCGVPINDFGAMNRSVYDDSSAQYHDNKNGYKYEDQMHEEVPKFDARTTNDFTPIEISKKKRPPPPGFEHVVPTPRRLYTCVNETEESYLFRNDSSERNNNEGVEKEDDLCMGEHRSVHKVDTSYVEAIEPRVMSQDRFRNQVNNLNEETQDRIEGHDEMEGVKVEVDTMAQRRPSKEGNVLASTNHDSGHSTCHHSITLSNDSAHSLVSTTTTEDITNAKSCETIDANNLVIEELEEDNIFEEHATKSSNGCFPCKIMAPINATKDLARRIGSILQNRKKESKQQSTMKEASKGSRLYVVRGKIVRTIKSILTRKH